MGDRDHHKLRDDVHDGVRKTVEENAPNALRNLGVEHTSAGLRALLDECERPADLKEEARTQPVSAAFVVVGRLHHFVGGGLEELNHDGGDRFAPAPWPEPRSR